MSETFGERLAGKVRDAAREVGDTLTLKVVNNEVALEALQSVVKKTVGYASRSMLRIADEHETYIPMEKATAAIDLALGDVVELSSSGFRAFCEGENMGGGETYHILYEYRTAMIARLQQAFAESLE